MFCFLDLFVTGITKHLLVESSYFISYLNSPRTPANCISISRSPQNACSKSSSRLRSQSKFQALQVLSRGWKQGSTPSGRGLGRACSSPTSAILPSPTEHPAAADWPRASPRSKLFLPCRRHPAFPVLALTSPQTFSPGCRQSDVPSSTFRWPWSCGNRLLVLLD